MASALSFEEATQEQVQRLKDILDRIPAEYMEFLWRWAEGEHAWYVEDELRHWEEKYK